MDVCDHRAGLRRLLGARLCAVAGRSPGVWSWPGEARRMRVSAPAHALRALCALAASARVLTRPRHALPVRARDPGCSADAARVDSPLILASPPCGQKRRLRSPRARPARSSLSPFAASPARVSCVVLVPRRRRPRICVCGTQLVGEKYDAQRFYARPDRLKDLVAASFPFLLRLVSHPALVALQIPAIALRTVVA